MPEKSKRSNHPLISYLLGFVVMVLTLLVLTGVLHHLAFSHHGPQLLTPVKEKYLEGQKSAILDKAQQLEDLEQHRHFHHVADYPRISENKRPVCFLCHSDYPHNKHKPVRGLMNMHTQYFACETCHIKERPGAKIVYKWYSPFEENPKGPFMGTEYDPKTEKLISGDPFSKIAPYFKYDLLGTSTTSFVKTDNIWSTIQTQDAPLARDYVNVRDKLSPEEREGVKNKFHENIKPKGHDCKVCHSEKSIFDFESLGFSENRIKDLMRMEIIGMITKYEEFYFPDLLK